MWSIPYKIITNKILPATTIASLENPLTHEHTIYRQTTIEVLLQALFPRDNQNTDNPEHTRLRQLALSPYMNPTHPDVVISTQQILEQLKTTQKRKAPGQDSITYEHINKMAPHIVYQLADIYTASLNYGVVPRQ